MAHHHHHAHSHAERQRRALWLALVLNAAFTVVEAVGGLLTGSLALLADAGHMLSDVAALGLALFALWFAHRPADPKRTFGYMRAETLAALVNAVTLVLICIFIFLEAYRRVLEPRAVASAAMLVIAMLGLVINIVSAVILYGVQHESLNIRGAALHMLADALGSLGAIAAALMILATGWTIADAIASVAIALLILASAWRLLSDCVHVLMQGTPRHIDLRQLEQVMRQVEGVLEVHDLHVWSMGTGAEVMTGHVVVVAGMDQERSHAVLHQLTHRIRDQFGIVHSTIQLEHENLRLQPDARFCSPAASSGAATDSGTHS
jgi:cobalt-zinc-cadmium efflux system protein